MLQQILKDLWVDPELLAELDEDMKQTLFCHMRQEQVRRWHMWDKEQEEEDRLREKKVLQSKSREKEKNKVQFLMGADGEPWVWVMGEHPQDKTIEEILEEEAIEKARKQAEKETEELRKNVAVELTEIIDFNQRQIQEYMKVSEKEELPMDLYCTVDEIREPSRHTVSLDISNNKDITAAIQEIAINKPRQVAQQIAQWEQRLLERRTSQIFQTLRDQRKEVTKQAEEAEHLQENLWREQEKRAKEAESQIREIARRAREEHRKTLLESNSVKESLNQEPTITPVLPMLSDEKECLSTTEPRKPPGKIAIIEWFHKNEVPRRAGLDNKNEVESWFHGLISRAEAETLMNEKPSGTFLVRVSERIWGYAITYMDNGKCKHYLVDASSDNYKFLGTNHICHSTLGDLVEYHRKYPITSIGGEILSYECHRSSLPSIYLGVPGRFG